MSASPQPIIRRPAVSALALICAAQFVLQLDFSIVNVALPTMQRELGFAAADLQWVVTGYALTFGSLLLLGGRVGDSLATSTSPRCICSVCLARAPCSPVSPWFRQPQPSS